MFTSQEEWILSGGDPSCFRIEILSNESQIFLIGILTIKHERESEN